MQVMSLRMSSPYPSPTVFVSKTKHVQLHKLRQSSKSYNTILADFNVLILVVVILSETQGLLFVSLFVYRFRVILFDPKVATGRLFDVIMVVRNVGLDSKIPTMIL